MRPVSIGLAAGIAYWSVVTALGGVGEPWDAAGYWTIWYPLALVIAAVCGRLMQGRSWLAGAAIVPAQGLVMLAAAESTPVWPLAVFWVALLSLPGAAAALLGAGIKPSRS